MKVLEDLTHPFHSTDFSGEEQRIPEQDSEKAVLCHVIKGMIIPVEGDSLTLDTRRRAEVLPQMM